MSYNDIKSKTEGLLSLEPTRVAAAHKGATLWTSRLWRWLAGAPTRLAICLLPGWGVERQG